MPRNTQRGQGEPLFDYTRDRPTIFDPRDYGSSGSESAEPFSPHDPARIPPPEMRVLKGSDSPQLWKRPQSQAHQLPMFMSAREIKTQYQPLEGDRQEHYDWREGEPTFRSRNTAGQSNAAIKSADAGWLRRRGGVETGMKHYRVGHDESDEQLWNRKLEESQLSRGEYEEVHGGGGSSASQGTPGYETIMDRAGRSAPFTPSTDAGTRTWESHQDRVDEYVGEKVEQHREQRYWRDQGSLYDTMYGAMQPGGEGFKGVIHLGTGGPHGSSDKPQVFGGHHRIAAMNDIQPDRLLPVIHNRQFAEARGTATGPWKYT